MLPPDREREWSNFAGKSKVLISPLKLFLVVLILKQIFSRSTFGALHIPHWQKLTKVNVLHTLP